MKDNKYNRMFSVSSEKMIFHNPETGETQHYVNQNKHNFDLNNESIYNEAGELISEGTQIKYNSLFIIFFFRCSIIEAKEFLEYHYSYTPIKEQFLDYIEFGLATYERLSDPIKSIALRWVNEVRSEIAAKKQKDSENLFLHFDQYFDANSIYDVYATDYLYQYSIPTMEFFQKMAPYNEAVNEKAGVFINEIRNNVIKLSAADKIKIYLGQIQSKLNALYAVFESNQEHEFLKHRDFHSSIPKIQGLIRDIAIKNGIELLGDIITQKLPVKEAEDQNVNPRPDIFINIFSYQMFLSLSQLTVKEESAVADFSFIFHRMKKDKLFINDLKHRTFIGFVNSACGAKLSVTKLPFKNQEFKKPVYSSLYSQYQKLLKATL